MPEPATPPAIAGQVYEIPWTRASGGDDKDFRRHVLLNDCRDTHGGTLAAASATGNEHRVEHAPAHPIPLPPGWSGGRLAPTGFTAPVLVFPGWLVYRAVHRLPPLIGRAGAHLGGIRGQMIDALGIGRGTWEEAPAEDAGSVRGRVVAFSQVVRGETFMKYGLVLTQHSYSAKRRLQVVAPVLPGLFRDGPHDHRVGGELPWVRALGESGPKWGEGAVVGVSYLFSVDDGYGDVVSLPNGGAWPTVDDATLQAVEALVVSRFSLPMRRSADQGRAAARSVAR